MQFHLCNLFSLSPQDIKIICAFGFSPKLGKLNRIHKINFFILFGEAFFSNAQLLAKNFQSCIKKFIILLFDYTSFYAVIKQLGSIIIYNGQIHCKLYNLVMRGIKSLQEDVCAIKKFAQFCTLLLWLQICLWETTQFFLLSYL